MVMNELVFEWLVWAALVVTCVAPVLLLGLFIKDFMSQTLW